MGQRYRSEREKARVLCMCTCVKQRNVQLEVRNEHASKLEAAANKKQSSQTRNYPSVLISPDPYLQQILYVLPRT